MSLDLGIPDGEYELELSDVLQNQFQRSQDSRSVRPIHRTNDEILSIRYGFRPDSIDDTKITELMRDEKSLKSSAGGFQLRSESTEHDKGILFEGSCIQPNDLDCILLFNTQSNSFELQKLDLQLRTTSIKNRTPNNKKLPQDQDQLNEPKSERASPQPSSVPSPIPAATSTPTPTSTTTALKRRPVKEPSIFQPKSRSKTPLSKPPTTKKASGKKSPEKVYDDEVPLSRLNLSQSLNSTASGGGAVAKSLNPSPLNSARTSPEKTQLSKTVINANITLKRTSPSPTSSLGSSEKKSKPVSKSKNATKKPEPQSTVNSPLINPISRNVTPQPRSNSNNSTFNSFKPMPNQVSSKKPPSTISTPTIQQESLSEDDEFGSLVDELEEELLSEDNSNFITIEDGTSKETSYDKTFDFNSSKNGNGPMNFRHLAGVNSKDEDELSSSEEE